MKRIALSLWTIPIFSGKNGQNQEIQSFFSFWK